MLAIVGFVCVIGMVFGGYLLAGYHKTDSYSTDLPRVFVTLVRHATWVAAPDT